MQGIKFADARKATKGKERRNARWTQQTRCHCQNVSCHVHVYYSFLRLLSRRIIIFCCTDRYKTALSTFRADSLATGPRNTHSTTRGRSLQSEIEVRFARIMSRATIPPRISLLPRPSACHVSIVRSKHVSFELLLFVFPRFPLPPYFFYFFLFSSPPPRGRGRIVL